MRCTGAKVNFIRRLVELFIKQLRSEITEVDRRRVDRRHKTSYKTYAGICSVALEARGDLSYIHQIIRFIYHNTGLHAAVGYYRIYEIELIVGPHNFEQPGSGRAIELQCSLRLTFGTHTNHIAVDSIDHNTKIWQCVGMRSLQGIRGFRRKFEPVRTNVGITKLHKPHYSIEIVPESRSAVIVCHCDATAKACTGNIHT